ncbi:hypothetical protein CapIbe_005069 [Capra ibex]
MKFTCRHQPASGTEAEILEHREMDLSYLKLDFLPGNSLGQDFQWLQTALFALWTISSLQGTVTYLTHS